tara:strand:- start:46 stop:231 length:186 start_codon:yes stop_codon:yes gene_type:complete
MMSNSTEKLHDDLRRDKILNEIQFLAEQLKGEFSILTCSDSSGLSWSKITIVYDKQQKKEP